MSYNLFWGIITVFICTVAYWMAFKNAKLENHTLALTLLIIAGFLLRMYTCFDLYLHAWDERYHALVAKHMLTNFLKPTLYENPVLPYDYKNFKTASIWVHKQPIPLWLIALSLKFFGVHTWSVRIPSVLLSTISIKLIYDIASNLYDKKTGFIAAFLLSIHGLIIELAAGRTATDHVDIAFMFFVLLGVWCAVKNSENRKMLWAIYTGISIGCAILCKWLPAFIVLPVWLLIMYRNEKNWSKFLLQFAVIILAAIAIALPWQLYIFHKYPVESLWELKFNSMHIHEVLANQTGNWFYHFNYLRMNFGELVYLPVIWFTVMSVKKKNLYDLAMVIWFWVPYLFFSFCATKMQAYTIFAAPAVFIIIAKTYQYFLQLYQERQANKWIFIVLAYGFILLPVRYSIERIKPFNIDYDRYPDWEKKITAIKNSKENNSKTVFVNCNHAIELMFETDCVAYEEMPGPSEIANIQSNGYVVKNWQK